MFSTKNSECLECGKKLEIFSGSFSGNVKMQGRRCPACGVQVLYYTIPEDYEICIKRTEHTIQKEMEETRNKFIAAFTLAGITILSHWAILNEYWSTRADWLLVKTSFGLIKVGWGKRVINLDWSDTRFVVKIPDDVTKEDYMAHAWTYGKLIEYLSLIKEVSCKKQD